jgi:hypothetical protein
MLMLARGVPVDALSLYVGHSEIKEQDLFDYLEEVAS